jgi:short-subunit dehydrogenase
VTEHEAPSGAAPAAPSPRAADGGFAYRGAWALVTGASMGIGEAFAWALARRGMNLVLCARSEERLAELARQIQAEHRVQARVVAADLSHPGEAARAWAEAGAHGRIYLLVNNAGFGLHGRFEELPAHRQAEMVALNCTAVLELAHSALAQMRPRGAGGIINVGSVAAFQPVPMKAAYAATKAFVLSLSEAMAEENRGSGVRILCLSPGPTPTGFQAVAGTRVELGQPGVLPAEAVVDAALAAFDAGKTHVAPGLMNRVSTTFARMLPMNVAARIARRVNESR